jgi:hypothetical protein
MEDLEEEVDALFELYDQKYFEIWRRIARLAMDRTIPWTDYEDGFDEDSW